LSAQEEIFMGRWAHSMPVIRHFNRAARVFLNQIRLDHWAALRKSFSEGKTPLLAEDIQYAKFVNQATARGSLGKMGNAAAPLLSRVFFAPRYRVSRAQLLVGQSMWGGTAKSRAVIASEYARAAVGLGVLSGLVGLALGVYPKEHDWRSSDFWKFVVGKTHVDILAGLGQFLTFVGRTVNQETKTLDGRIHTLRAGPVSRAPLHRPRLRRQYRPGSPIYGQETWFDKAADFGRSSLHPVPSAVANLFSGSDIVGRPSTVASEASKMAAPITYYDIYQVLQNEELPQAVILSLLGLIGVSLQTHEKRR